MKLSRLQRQRLFAGDYRPLVVDTKPELEPGDRFVLSWSRPSPIHDGDGRRLQPPSEPLLSLLIRRVVRTQTPDAAGVLVPRWVIRFVVEDRRQQTRLLRHSPPVYDATLMQADQIHPPTEEEELRAAQESAYTSSSVGAIDHLEAVDKDTLDRFAKEAHVKNARNRRERAQRDEKDLEVLKDHLARLRAFGRENGIDVNPEVRQLERQIENKLRRRAA